ncbi:MAG: hypothetical protein OXD49_06430, partial [Candidatus Poribacteria bacterium]|nr:hypothetical protein [Candidatus Poribacteria bacterium]
MHEIPLKMDIQRGLSNFTEGQLAKNAMQLLKVLGYESQRTLSRPDNTVKAFLEDFDTHRRMNRENT